MSDLPVPPPLEPPPAAEPPRAPLDAAASTAGPSPQVARPRDRIEDSDARILATLVQLSTLLLPCVIAAVAYLIVRFAPRVPLAPVQREFIAFHALQAAVFHGVLWAFIKLPLVTVSLGFLLPIVVVSPVLSVIWALRASQGEWSHYPLLAGLAARSAD